MSAIDIATEFIKPYEGLRLSAYPDPAPGGDPITIGYGSTGPDIKMGMAWTKEQAECRLRQDVSRFAKGVDELVKAELSDEQMAALISFAYNVGLGNLKSSTLLRKVNAGDLRGAADQFIRWNRASGKVMNGLTRRRNAEAALFRGSL